MMDLLAVVYLWGQIHREPGDDEDDYFTRVYHERR